jgi:hypothetical protein
VTKRLGSRYVPAGQAAGLVGPHPPPTAIETSAIRAHARIDTLAIRRVAGSLVRHWDEREGGTVGLRAVKRGAKPHSARG